MKTTKLILIVLTVSLLFFNCKDKQTEEEIEVEKYVNTLKNNQCEDVNLPAFSDKHIDELLKYRNNKEIITEFPRNPLSSLYQEKCELGIYILWTIESIRVNAIGGELFAGRFPSQNPILKLRYSDELELIYDTEVYQILSDAYYLWWTNNKNKTILEIMEIDPLKNTEYAWH